MDRNVAHILARLAEVDIDEYALKMFKAGVVMNALGWGVLGLGTLVSFVVSVLAIRFLMSYIRKNDFKVFGVYRIVLGLIILAVMLF